MPDIVLPHRYIPREYQMPFWKYMESGGKRYAGAWHRRAGKDHSIFAYLSTAAFQRVGLYWHILPTYEMGRKIIWNGITGDGTRFIDLFPKELVKRTRDDLMLIELINGSIYQVVGGDDPDRLRGPNPVGVVFSEYAFFPTGGAWDVVRPILNENGGWAAFISTPQGRNHFYDIIEHAKKSPGWFAELNTVETTKRPDGTPVITQESIEDDRQSGMSEAMIRQEYYCSFDTPFEGAIYGDQFRTIQAQGRIEPVPYRPELPVTTWWDIGVNDLGAVWFMQKAGRNRYFINYRQESGMGLDEWIRYVLNQPYVYDAHIGPWDLGHREKLTATSLQMSALKLGLRFRVAPKAPIQDGIQEVRRYLAKYNCYFDQELCRDGVDAMMRYRWKKDKQGNPTQKPDHDYAGASHGADAFRVGAIMEPDIDESVKQRAQLADSEYDIYAPSREGRSFRQEYAES